MEWKHAIDGGGDRWDSPPLTIRVTSFGTFTVFRNGQSYITNNPTLALAQSACEQHAQGQQMGGLQFTPRGSDGIEVTQPGDTSYVIHNRAPQLVANNLRESVARAIAAATAEKDKTITEQRERIEGLIRDRAERDKLITEWRAATAEKDKEIERLRARIAELDADFLDSLQPAPPPPAGPYTVEGGEPGTGYASGWIVKHCGGVFCHWFFSEAQARDFAHALNTAHAQRTGGAK